MRFAPGSSGRSLRSTTHVFKRELATGAMMFLSRWSKDLSASRAWTLQPTAMSSRVSIPAPQPRSTANRSRPGPA